ncbi:MAG: hypothetical protein KIS92_04825 [Planctomycetota bacterium]|nr:hypothetical protein [Planctomycetota bacterium]
MVGPNADYSIVLRGRFPGKDRAVAAAMSRVFGQNEAWGLQVVGASPITILTTLTAAQAQAIGSALIEIENVGCRFQVQQGIDTSCPTIHWAAPPRINGRALDEFSGSGQHKLSAAEAHIPCPHCAKVIVIRLAPQGVPATGNTMMLSVPGPLGTIQPAVGGPTIIQPQAPVPIPVPVPSGSKIQIPNSNTPSKLPSLPPAAPDLPAPIPIPQRPPQVKTSGTLPQVPKPIAAPQPIAPQPIPIPIPQAAALEPVADEGLEDLEPLEELPSIPTPPAGRPAAAAPRPVPLPEVPVIPSAPPAPAPVRPMPVASMDPRMSGPMALEEFEAGLAKAQPAHAPAQVPEAAPMPGGSNGDSAASLSRIISENPDAICSIFIGKNANPKVHALVAEIQGVTTKEAQKLCAKPVVPIVKDIPVSDADPIRRRFLEVGVNPRITFRR